MNNLKSFLSTFTANKFEQFFFFLTVLLLPTQLGKHFWPEFATIFSIRTDYFAPNIYLWDLILVILLGLFLYQRKKLRSTPLFLVLFFCLSQIGSLFLADNVGAGLVRLGDYFLVGLFGVYIASSNFNLLKLPLYFGLLGGILYSSLIAILQVLKGGTLGLWILGERSFSLNTISIATFDWYGQVFLRAYATFPHPNVLAAFLLVSIGLLIWLREKQVGKKLCEVEWSIIIAGSFGLLLTFSRVALVFYGAVFAYLLKERIKLLLIIFLFLLPFLYVRFHSAFNFDQLSFIRREELALQSLKMIEISPIFGVGLNNFIHELAYNRIVSGESRFLQPVHSIFLLTFAETGLVGFLGMLILLDVAFIKVVKEKGFVLVFIWLAILGMGIFDHYFLTLAQGQRLLFLVWGLSMLELNNERRS